MNDSNLFDEIEKGIQDTLYLQYHLPFQHLMQLSSHVKPLSVSEAYVVQCEQYVFTLCFKLPEHITMYARTHIVYGYDYQSV